MPWSPGRLSTFHSSPSLESIRHDLRFSGESGSSGEIPLYSASSLALRYTLETVRPFLVLGDLRGGEVFLLGLIWAQISRAVDTKQSISLLLWYTRQPSLEHNQSKSMISYCHRPVMEQTLWVMGVLPNMASYLPLAFPALEGKRP